MKSARRRIDEHGGLARKGLTRHEPIKGILQGAREPMGVFGGGDDERVARADELAQGLDWLGLRLVLNVLVGV